MTQAPKAAFKFNSYKISEFSFSDPEDGDVEGLVLSFDPNGKYIEENSTAVITFNFSASYKQLGKDVVLASVVMRGLFSFKENCLFEDIPPYFYDNSIAIMFPYLRAFLSSMTQLANVKQVILPLMNLSEMGKELKDKMTKINIG